MHIRVQKLSVRHLIKHYQNKPKDQEQVNIEVGGFKQCELARSPTTNILEDN